MCAPYVLKADQNARLKAKVVALSQLNAQLQSQHQQQGIFCEEKQSYYVVVQKTHRGRMCTGLRCEGDAPL